MNGGVRVNLDLNKLQIVICPSCGASKEFVSRVVFRIVPAVQSPSGKRDFVMQNVFRCAVCDADLDYKKALAQLGQEGRKLVDILADNDQTGGANGVV